MLSPASDVRALRVLVLGGYGTFGRRLVELLSDEPDLDILVAGRSRAKAEAFMATLEPAARLEAIELDRDGDIDAALALLRPAILVDVTGPFQTYGADPYRLAEACLRHGINYLDFSDCSDFTIGIARLDDEARAKGLFVLSAVSSTPALSGAVARHLSKDMAGVESIEGGIAPSPFAGIGRNVIEAITSYAGRPVRVTRNGVVITARGLAETRRMTIAPPGVLPLRSRCFALVDVPDLMLLPDVVPGTRSVWFGAGTAPQVYLHMLVLLARLARIGLILPLRSCAGIFHAVANRLTWGEARGGMFVRLRGRDGEGRLVERSWHLIAEGDTGPSVPAMAADAVIRKCLAGRPPKPGAHHAGGELALEDFERGFAAKAIVTGVRNEEDLSHPLYRRILGSAMETLPEPIRDLHQVETKRTFTGRATVDRGTGLLARLIGALYRFPDAGTDIAVDVLLQRRGHGEVWQRTFAGRTFRSHQRDGRGKSARMIIERFGPVTVDLALVTEEGRLVYVVRRARFLGIPMPAFMAPGGRTFEHVEDGRFRFHVEIGHPWFGLVVRYRGWLVPTEADTVRPSAAGTRGVG